jgi:hypothetical protein
LLKSLATLRESHFSQSFFCYSARLPLHLPWLLVATVCSTMELFVGWCKFYLWNLLMEACSLQPIIFSILFVELFGLYQDNLSFPLMSF